MKFVKPLEQDTLLTLQEALHNHLSHRVRTRAHAILLSHKRYSLSQLSDVFDVCRDTISQWIEEWESLGLVGLMDKPRCGRPPIFSEEECEQFKALIDKNPHQPKTAMATFQAETGKCASPDTYKRLLKKDVTAGSV